MSWRTSAVPFGAALLVACRATPAADDQRRLNEAAAALDANAAVPANTSTAP